MRSIVWREGVGAKYENEGTVLDQRNCELDGMQDIGAKASSQILAFSLLSTGSLTSLGRSGHQQGRGVLWVYGDSLNRYFYQSILKRPLCWQVFRACYHTMLWVYVLKQTAKDEMNLMFGRKPINIPRILYELQSVVTRSDMDQDSALILNAGVHLLKSASFYNYQKIINGFIGVLKRYYRGTVIWKSITAIHDQRELYSGCFRRFHTEQVRCIPEYQQQDGFSD